MNDYEYAPEQAAAEEPHSLEPAQAPLPAESESAPWEMLRADLCGLRELFETRLQADAHKERLFDELHREVIGYRNGTVEKIADTMAMDIISILDYLVPYTEKIAQEVANIGEGNSVALCHQMLNELEGLQLDLASILDRQGVESFTLDTLDTKCQRILSSVTEPGEEDRQILQSIKAGYTRNGRLLRKEHIRVIQVTAPKEG